ncbi:hypothetical protein EJB05_20364, partial [Eragrostis curvula]
GDSAAIRRDRVATGDLRPPRRRHPPRAIQLLVQATRRSLKLPSLAVHGPSSSALRNCPWLVIGDVSRPLSSHPLMAWASYMKCDGMELSSEGNADALLVRVAACISG